MKLKAVLREHEKSAAKGGLQPVLGDPFLLSFNAMYASTRRLVLGLGFRFVPAWETYKRAPLFELSQILTKKKIPYNDSVPTLKRLVRDYKLDDEMDDVPVNTVSSHFHESAHGISHAIFSDVAIQTKNEKLLVALLCESYANATESMAVTYADDDVHRFFLQQNSYIYASADRVRKRQEAAKVWGHRQLFRLLWISYLYSNFLVDDVERDELEGAIQFALEKPTLTKSDVQRAVRFFRDAQELSAEFRVKTARIYMRTLGLRGSAEKNLSFNFSRVFTNHAGLVEAFARLSTMTCGS